MNKQPKLCFVIALDQVTWHMSVDVSYWCTGPSAHPSPMFSGVDASDVPDVLAVDDPALVAHFDALAYDVSFRS